MVKLHFVGSHLMWMLSKKYRNVPEVFNESGTFLSLKITFTSWKYNRYLLWHPERRMEAFSRPSSRRSREGRIQGMVISGVSASPGYQIAGGSLRSHDSH